MDYIIVTFMSSKIGVGYGYMLDLTESWDGVEMYFLVFTLEI